MELELNPQQPQDFAKFQAFEIKNTHLVKGGNGDDPDDNGVIGSSDIVDI